MDFKHLLQDLHFQLSNNDSEQCSDPKQNNSLEKFFFNLEIEERSRMTEKWVKQARLHNRQRSVSSDSYFGVESVCDKLKKSFLKPHKVTECDLEELQLRMSQMKIDELNFETSLSSVQKHCIPIVTETATGIGDGSEKRRCRSRTVPVLCYRPSGPDTAQNEFNPDQGEEQSYKLASMPPVPMEDILLDENRNQVEKMPPKNCKSSRPLTIDDDSTIAQSFRIECIFPSVTDLKMQSWKPIRPNRIIGCYDNEHDYLKTQFDLLKADFILPLKEGISDYKRQRQKGMTPDEVKTLQLYQDVYVMESCIKQYKIGVAVDMGPEICEKIGEKDFMSGSLILLTPNHFNDIYVGIVLSKNFAPSKKQVVNGYPKSKPQKNTLVIQLLEASHFDPTLRNKKMLLAESTAFFQPYFYVMKIFQGMVDSDLPFKEHLINSQIKTSVGPPAYLQSHTKYVLEDNIPVTVLDNASWPSAKVLGVNDSQLRALKKALSEKLVLIQGPPGTGKTYLGCKIAKALLQNQQVWNRSGNCPMLLMCQTNHALDQFMELLEPVCKKIIRIGSQSKSDILAPYNIRVLMRKSRDIFPEKSDITQFKLELKSLSQNIQECLRELSKLNTHGVIDLQTFVDLEVMKVKHSVCFTNSDNFLMWLEEARECQVVDECLGHQANSKTSLQKSVKCHEHSHKCIETYVSKLDGGDDPDVETTSLNDFGFCLSSIKYIMNISDLEFAHEEWQSEHSEQSVEELVMYKTKKKEMENRLNFFKDCLVESSESKSLPSSVKCLWRVSPSLRWVLYRSWVNKLKAKLQSYLQLLESKYLSASSALADLEQHKKLSVMRKADLVGMTTSAAARLYPVLLELQSPIVLIEEAAEVHESHIVATVTKYCQHLILLGDHKQLRPRPASYQLSKTHLTDVSLFERLLLNKTATVNTLLTQHRMQPQISALIKPSIYAKLYDHDCTRNRESILGMRKNVFFLSHQWLECRNQVTGSYSNPKEATMAVEILRYLLKQGYRSSEVCILTAYRQQVTEIERICSFYEELGDAKVLTVDNFQGEESRIVILSLVRNNRGDQIGFLKIENRVCVALSRARDGLYILGNMQLLSRNSALWSSIYKVLHNEGSVGQSIPIKCTEHPEYDIAISKPEDFSEKGCGQQCSFKLPCGHICIAKCHSHDASSKYRCLQYCTKICINGHKCQKRCWQDCGNCKRVVTKQLTCGYWVRMKCRLPFKRGQ